ncbi:MAG TPA: glycosyltransferase family A protein [Bryobacteraceae bacterium]|jgi:hypothetical protein|nr:glycosyltransferase family A protein [Bryobacteraceae bacterium]
MGSILDGDDAWLTGYLEAQVQVTRTDPAVDMVFPDGLFFGKTTLAGRRTMEFSPADGKISFLRVLSGEVTVGYCALVRARS